MLPGLDLAWTEILGGFDAGNGESVLFLSQDRYLRYDQQQQRLLPDYPKSISDNWAGLGVDSDKIVGVLKWNTNRIHVFFNDGTYSRVTLSSQSVDSGYPRAITNGNWPGLGAFGQEITSILNYGTQYADVLLTNQRVARFDIAQDRVLPGFPKAMACDAMYRELLRSPDGQLAIACPPNLIVGPYLQHPSPNGMTLMVETEQQGTEFWYRPWGSQQDYSKITATTSSYDPLGLVREGRIEGLNSNTLYEYRVATEQGQYLSPSYAFKTYPVAGDGVNQGRFIAISDTQNGVHPVLRNLVRHGFMQHECEADNPVSCAQNIAGITIAGDITEVGGNRSHQIELRLVLPQ